MKPYYKLLIFLVMVLIVVLILNLVLPDVGIEHKPYEKKVHTYWEPPHGDIDINLSKLNIPEGNVMQFCNHSLYNDCRPKNDCCYPSECSQAKHNPENCDCMYMVECYNG